MKAACATSNEIKIALAKKHGNSEFFITECKNGPTRTGMLQFDGIAIYKSWAHPNIVGYEIKVSRSDFQRDNKFFGYMPYCHELYFVVPTGLIDRMELPNEIGLMYYNPEKKSLTTKKKAIHRNIEINADMLLYIIMNRLESDRLPFHTSKAEYWQDWLENKITNRDLGYQVNCKLLKHIQELEKENSRYQRFKEEQSELSQIREILKKHNLSTWRNAPQVIDAALTRSYPMELDNLQAGLRESIEVIERLKNKSKQNEEII